MGPRVFAALFALAVMFMCLFFMKDAINRGQVGSAVLQGFLAVFNGGMFFYNLNSLRRSE